MQSDPDIQIDPVCGSTIDRDEAMRAGHAVIYEDTEYFFCSAECQQDFRNAPRYFLAHVPGPFDYGGVADWQP